MSKSDKGHNTVKVGLGLICLSIGLSIIMALVMAVCYLINKTPATIITINSIVLLIAKLAALMGVLCCFLSGQKNFTFALIMYSALVILLIIFAALKKDPSGWVFGLFYGLLAVAHLSILLGLRTVSASRKKFNTSIITICLFLFVIMVVLILLWSFSIINGNWVGGVIKLLDIAESVFFLLAIITTYKALR